MPANDLTLEQLRDVCPTWKPGCGELPTGLPPLMRGAIASPRIGAFLRSAVENTP